MTLLDFLKEKYGLSGKKAKQQIDRGAVLVNGKVERFAKLVLHSNDVVSYESVAEISPEFTKDAILYEDRNLVAYNKPAGMLSEQKYFPENLKLVHRLDQYTTGVLFLAKNDNAENELLRAFRERLVEKEYLALVDGETAENSGAIATHLAKKWQNKWGSAAKGKYAETCWQVDRRLKEATLLKVFPKTGRTHQIRVHLSEMGHPVLGDALYGKTFSCPYKPQYTLLHCARMRYKDIEVNAGPHEALLKALKEIPPFD